MNELMQDFLNGRNVLVICPTYFAIKVFAERLLSRVYGVTYKHSTLRITADGCGTIQFAVKDSVGEGGLNGVAVQSIYITQGVNKFSEHWLRMLRSPKPDNLKLVFLKDKWEGE